VLDPPAQSLGEGVRARPRQTPTPGAGPPAYPLGRLPGSASAVTMAIVDQRYTVNSPEVIEESVDGEVLIVHLGTGAYYSSDGAGEFIWRRIAAGHTGAGVAEALAGHFSLPAEAAAATVERMLGQYLEEGLLRERGERPVEEVEAPAAAAYAEPILNKYTDMEELLLLDPVHDVEEEGWPHARPDLAAG
jgi:hypothetical protein